MYLNWETQAHDYYVIDIEADSLYPKQIWCLCWENVKTKEKGQCINDKEILDFFASTRGSRYIGHNILKFDAYHLNRLLAVNVKAANCVDTLVLSTLYSPSLTGGHSLEAWGIRLKMPKGEFNDWSKLSDEMLAYCRQDVSVTAALFRSLTKTMSKIGFSEMSCYIQHIITGIAFRQQIAGFYFDGQRAILLYQQLRNIEADLQERIRHAFPAERVLVRTGKSVTKHGSLSAQYIKDCERFIVERDGDVYRAYEDVPFNVGSPKQRTERLLALGWKPDELTPTGLPKATEKSLVAFAEASGIPEVALITRWMSVNGRANMINTWLDNWNEQTGCIHGKLFVADTLRFRHQAPNTANIPAVRVGKDKVPLLQEAGYFTYEARDLWTARPGRILVGTDAAGLELRMLAHFLNRPAFTEQVVNGDPHQYNADLAGVTRPRAKTLLYAIQYGAQAGKVAQIIEGTKAEGAAMREQFLERLGIKEILESAIAEQQRGRVLLCDGSKVVCPSPHAALNYKLQGSGARVMALASIILEKSIFRHGLDCIKVGDIHDEWQYDCNVRDADEFARLSVEAIREAGRELKLNVPLDGTAKKGLTWAETH